MRVHASVVVALVAASLLFAGRTGYTVEITGGTPASDIDGYLNGGGNEKLPKAQSDASANADAVDAKDCDAVSKRLDEYQSAVEAGKAQSADQVNAIRSDLGEARIAIARLNAQIAGLAALAAAGDKNAERKVTQLRSRRLRLAKSTNGCRSSILKRLAGLERSVKSLKANDQFFFRAWKKQGTVDMGQNARIKALEDQVKVLKGATSGTPPRLPHPQEPRP